MLFIAIKFIAACAICAGAAGTLHAQNWSTTPEQFAAALKVEQDKWTRLVHERQLSLE